MTNPMIAEAWLPIVGYERDYEISNCGRIKSKKHGEKILAGGIGTGGYPQFSLLNNGIQKNHTAHELVLTAFVGPRPEGMQCRHLDGNPENNHIDNLKWGTPSENFKDAVKHGTYAHGSRHGMSKLDETQVRSIKRLKHLCGWSGAEIARLYGIHKDTVSYMARDITWPHVKI